MCRMKIKEQNTISISDLCTWLTMVTRHWKAGRVEQLGSRCPCNSWVVLPRRHNWIYGTGTQGRRSRFGSHGGQMITEAVGVDVVVPGE